MRVLGMKRRRKLNNSPGENVNGLQYIGQKLTAGRGFRSEWSGSRDTSREAGNPIPGLGDYQDTFQDTASV